MDVSFHPLDNLGSRYCPCQHFNLVIIIMVKMLDKFLVSPLSTQIHLSSSLSCVNYSAPKNLNGWAIRLIWFTNTPLWIPVITEKKKTPSYEQFIDALVSFIVITKKEKNHLMIYWYTPLFLFNYKKIHLRGDLIYTPPFPTTTKHPQWEIYKYISLVS